MAGLPRLNEGSLAGNWTIGSEHAALNGKGGTYIPMAKGFLYLVAIMDWHSRVVLGWRLSNTLGADFCVEVLQEALARHGKPEIFNTDQGCQFTGTEFIQGFQDRRPHGLIFVGNGRGADRHRD